METWKARTAMEQDLKPQTKMGQTYLQKQIMQCGNTHSCTMVREARTYCMRVLKSAHRSSSQYSATCHSSVQK